MFLKLLIQIEVEFSPFLSLCQYRNIDKPARIGNAQSGYAQPRFVIMQLLTLERE